MQPTGPLTGAFPALITPARPDGCIDEDAFASRVVDALRAGLDGVLVVGSTGEGPSLTSDQRAHLVGVAVEVAGDAPVIGCICGLTVAELVLDAERAAAAGAGAVLCLAPFYFPLTPAEQVAVYHEVADHSPVPVLAYHVPQRTGSELTPDAVVDLAAHPNVVGMKDSSGQLDRLRRMVAATREADFGILQGSGSGVLAALLAGAAGSITAISNVRAGDVVALHAAVAAGDLVAARDLQDRLAALSSALDAVPAPLAVALKALLEAEGEMPHRGAFAPLATLTDDAVGRLLADVGTRSA